MSNNRLVLDGLDELRAALRHLPTELADEAAGIVDNAAEVAAASLKQAYPLGDTGHLRAGVKVTTERSQFGVAGIVKSTSPHAHLWEFGTAVRHTRQGWNRGRMPSQFNQGLVGIASRVRQTMNAKLVELVRRAGFEVSGVV